MGKDVDRHPADAPGGQAAGTNAANPEPLEPQAWFRALGKLAERLTDAPTDQHETLLRHAYHLLQLTPRPLRRMVRPDLSEKRYEELLDCGAFESAAIGLVGHPITYTIFRPESGLLEAQVHLPGPARPIMARAPSLTMALLSAWTQSLVALEGGSTPGPLAAVKS